jgi:hypothetical protein
MNRQQFVIAATGLCFMGCADSPSPSSDELSAFDQAVLENTNAVEAAAIAYEHTNGFYPQFVCDEFIALLPDSTMLVNPATGEASEPVFYRVPELGSTAYRLFADLDEMGNRRIVGYYIVGHGEDRDFVISNVGDVATHLDREQVFFDNCTKLRDAAIAFAADNSGLYPVARESTNLLGNTVWDYLPSALVNPYTQSLEPAVWWTSGRWNPPAGMGEIGYLPLDIDGDGVWDGFKIEAAGCYAPLNSYFYEINPGETHEYRGGECINPVMPCIYP